MLSMITSTQLTKLGPKAYLEARPSMLFKHVVESILPEEKRSESSNSFFWHTRWLYLCVQYVCFAWRFQKLAGLHPLIPFKVRQGRCNNTSDLGQ